MRSVNATAAGKKRCIEAKTTTKASAITEAVAESNAYKNKRHKIYGQKRMMTLQMRLKAEWKKKEK